MTYPSSLLSPLPECTLPVSSCKLIQKKKKKPSLSTYNDLLEIQTHEYDHNSQLFQRELASMDQQLKKKLHRY